MSGTGVDECGVEGLGQPLPGLRGDPSAAGGSPARDLNEAADQVVPLPGQLAPAGAVGRQIGLSQLLPSSVRA
jgi:hypothetical protein